MNTAEGQHLPISILGVMDHCGTLATSLSAESALEGIFSKCVLVVEITLSLLSFIKI